MAEERAAAARRQRIGLPGEALASTVIADSARGCRPSTARSRKPTNSSKPDFTDTNSPR